MQETWRSEGDTSVPQHPTFLEISWATRCGGSLGLEQRRGRVSWFVLWNYEVLISTLLGSKEVKRHLLSPNGWALTGGIYLGMMPQHQLLSATKILHQFSQQLPTKILRIANPPPFAGSLAKKNRFSSGILILQCLQFLHSREWDFKEAQSLLQLIKVNIVALVICQNQQIYN